MDFLVKPIGYINTDFKEKFGIPRQSGRVKTYGTITVLPQYSDEAAFREIEGFNYLWLLFDFSEAHRKNWSPTVRPPRLGGNRKVGVFASRSPFRPNPIGLSAVKLLGAERTDGVYRLYVEGADLLDGTPILDIKPYLPSDCKTDAVGGYSDEVRDYSVRVVFPEELLLSVPEDKRETIIACLAEDPRPAYADDERSYGMRFGDYDIKFVVKGDILTVTAVESCK